MYCIIMYHIISHMKAVDISHLVDSKVVNSPDKNHVMDETVFH